MGILSGAEPLMVDVRQTAPSPDRRKPFRQEEEKTIAGIRRILIVHDLRRY
jgi:hypothetical protein